jgi:hypothetical protein
MTTPRLTHAARFTAVAAVLALLPACAAEGGGHDRASGYRSTTPVTSVAINKAALLHPKRKYYGIFVPGAPASIAPIDNIATETGKQPNLDMYFQAWDGGAASGQPNFNPTSAENACADGLLPMLTWESWNTSVTGDNDGTPGVAWSQPAFAPNKIINGKYDKYIRQSARLIASINCPIAVRFDQEVNGYWYPWGVNTDGMPGTTKSRAKHYIQMWRHVWKIFRNQDADNVLWVWSPNYQSAKHKTLPDLSATYPGKKYVDWVGIDGYYYNDPSQTFDGLFGSTIDQLKSVAPKKPWLIAETGVGTGPTKSSQITNLLHAVAHHSRFNGFIYFDQGETDGDRSDWRFDAPGDTADLQAFSAGINHHAYAAGKPGTL